MNILIAADMEGISGVVHWDQVTPGKEDYPRFCRLMTQDVNAAIRGAFDGSASGVWVSDGHNNGRNLLIEELDPRAKLNTGTPAPFSMVQGVERGMDGVCFVGYHARIGRRDAILEHTWSDERVANLWINGTLFGETGLNAGLCGHFGSPVIMVSGDQALCAEAQELLGAVETAAVKRAHGRMAAECLPPPAAQELIYNAACRAVEKLASAQGPQPLKISLPVHMAVEFVQSEMADKAVWMPGAHRGNDRRVEFTGADMVEIYGAFRTLLALAR